MSVGPYNELQNYIVDLESLSHDTSAVQYWISTEPSINKLGGGLAVDLATAPASQVYVERIFSVCGDFTDRRRNKTKKALREEFSRKLTL